MNIKSLLLGSAAALVAVTGARAADAVVAPEPEAVEYEPDPMARRETLEFVRAYYKISSKPARRRLADLVKTLGKAEDNED